jgi:CubicO group peptidase (beta-lactamase class C family)
MKPLLLPTAMLLLAFGCAPEPKKVEPPTPATVEELEQAIIRVLHETKTPGAGVVLVSKDKVLWTAGIGVADRATGRQVTPDTVFRAGSISKSFVALAVLKLQEEGKLHLDDRLRDLVGDMEFANPWEETDPVRLAHVIEHTAGFDDITVREYAGNVPDISVRDALAFESRPRTSRWRPGRFMSYSNAGPPLVAYAIERVTGRTFDRYMEEEIFKPLGIKTASFLLTDAVAENLAKCYRSDGVTEVPYWHIIPRPSGALNTTPSELARFVQLLLDRGTCQGVRLLNPESIDRMETPATSAAARKGLRRGYGLGNFMWPSYEGFRFQGHSGGGPGFLANYAYAPDHGVGYVVMINSDSFAAADRIDKLVLGYLTRDLAKPAPPTAVVPEQRLQGFAGYYEPHTPRVETLRFMERLLGLQHIAVDGGVLRASSLAGPPKMLIPVDDKGLFRGENDPAATMAFVEDDGERFLDGGMLLMGNYRQVPAWWVWGQGAIVVFSLVIMLSAVVFPLVWMPRRFLGRMNGVQHMNVRLLPLAAVLCLVAAFGLFLASITSAPIERLGNPTLWSVGFCVLTWLFAITTIAGLVQAIRARHWDIRPAVRRHALLVSTANVIVLAYLAYWGIIGLRTWA